jgi:hypothetical protein
MTVKEYISLSQTCKYENENHKKSLVSLRDTSTVVTSFRYVKECGHRHVQTVQHKQNYILVWTPGGKHKRVGSTCEEKLSIKKIPDTIKVNNDTIKSQQ